MKDFKTIHDLSFESANWHDPQFQLFRIGTCEGMWQSTSESFDIIAVVNNKPGNGHFKDVLQWFENSCYRDKKDLRVMEIWNDRLLGHLTSKLGFKKLGKNHAIKHWKKCKAKKLIHEN